MWHAAIAVPAPTSSYWLGLPYWLVGAILILALFGAFQVYYWVGRRLGERLYESRIGVKVGRERIQKIEGVVERWGRWPSTAASGCRCCGTRCRGWRGRCACPTPGTSSPARWAA
ncbi:DedA family protein [Nonomuraea thailandensis]